MTLLDYLPVVLAALFAAIGAAFVLPEAEVALRNFRRRRWRRVAGAVLDVQEVTERIGDARGAHDHTTVTLIYAYEAGGARHEGQWVDPPVPKGQPAFERGQTLTVYVDPADPSRSTADPKQIRADHALANVLIGAAFLALAYIAWRS